MRRLKHLWPLLLLLLLLSACGGTAATDAPDETTDPAEETEQQQESVVTPAITELDYYVTAADSRACLADADEVANFELLVDAVLAQETEVIYLSDDYDSNLRCVSALRQNPFFFFVEDLDFTSDHSGVMLSYAYSPQDQEAMLNYMTEEYIRLLNEIIHPGMNELDKVLAVYHYFAARIDYNYDWLEALNASDEKFLFPDIAIYEALSTNRGVCHSFTYLCEFALQQLDVECLRMSGTMTDNPDEGHMWLVARIDGKYYHFDPTWDSQGDGVVSLSYFGMTDRQRLDSGVQNWENNYDQFYGQVVCDDESLVPLQEAIDFATPQPPDDSHLIQMTLWDGTLAQYNTQEQQLIPLS